MADPVKKNYIYNLILSLVNILFPIVTFPYASHLLGPEGIGKVQFVSSFAQYFSMIAALGIPIYGVKEIAATRSQPHKMQIVYSELTLVYFIASIICTLLYFIIIYSFPYFKNDLHLYQYAVLIIILAFTAADWYYSGIEEFRAITLRSAFIKLLSLIALFLFVKTPADYFNYLLITIFSIVGNNIISFFYTFRSVSFTTHNLYPLRHLKLLLYIFSTTAAASLYTVWDTVLLGFLSDDTAVGLYTAAVKLAKITLYFVTSLGVVLIPKISLHFAQHNMNEVQKLLNKSFNFVIFFSIPILAGLVLLAPEFLVVFSGRRFLPATFAMQLLSPLPVFIGLGHLFLFQILIPGNKSKEMIVAVLGGVAVSIGANFLLVPHFRETGGAIANVLAECMVTWLYWRAVKKHYTFTYNWILLLKAAACCIPFIAVTWGVHLLHLSPVQVLLVTVAMCAIIYGLLQMVLFRNELVVQAFTYVYKKF
ncbi:flippase [Deminuibacter soli]|uniref:Flippase n=1 Tax=Deminuibacter soli TaxID=2291815 RepID=A0A3E1NFQ1_9BACT|nr:flippase [Deminuibacter soli]RFM26641.1 flippase [Deminuibacter soli]